MAQKQPEWYATVCDASPDAILLVDANGEIVYANARVEDMFGYEPTAVIGEPIELLVPESIRDEHVQLRNGYLEAPETRPMGASLDLKAERKDGSTFPVDISLSPISVDVEIEAMAAIRDISERETLRQKYRTILEAVPDAVIVANTETGEIVETNDQVAELFGYESEELIGERQTILHPSGEEDRYRTLFEHHIESGKAIFSELPDGSAIYIETKAGDRIPVEINARVFEQGDEPLIAGVFRDISTRLEHERQLEELHTASRRFVQAETQGELTDQVAEAVEAVLGFERNVVRLARKGDQLRPFAVTEQARTDMGPRPTYPQSGDNPAGQAYEQGEPVVIDDFENLDDGHQRSGVQSAMYIPIGEYGVLSIVDPQPEAFDAADVELAAIVAANARTALRRLEAQDALERQVDRLDKFASVVSHDLRNPLSVAEGWLEVAREADDSEELQRVSDALDRMDDIIEDTLTLARYGETVGGKEPIDLGHLAGECWHHVATRDARLEIENSLTINGDHDRLQHLLENLYRNAIEHGGDDVTVTVGAIDRDGFYVEDDGPGIPEDERESVFEPGFTTTATGTGFGLSIVKEIAESHGWEVGVTEGSDGGARFEFNAVKIVED